jgi:nicotinamidase-related amidase
MSPQTSKNSFRYANDGSVGSDQPMAIVIDIQDFDRLSREDTQAYADQLGENLSQLRENNIPVTWVTLTRTSAFHDPIDGEAPLPRGSEPSDWEALGFHGVSDEYENADIFRQFLQDHGPRTDEAVYQKQFKSALVEVRDAEASPEYQEILSEESGLPFEELQAQGTDEKTLNQYLGEQGVRHPLLIGAVSSHCISETAATARLKGMDPRIESELVLSWVGPEEEVIPSSSVLIWRDTYDSDQAAVEMHERKIQTKLTEIGEDGRRHFSEAERESISRIGFSATAEYIAAYNTTDISASPEAGIADEPVSGVRS